MIESSESEYTLLSSIFGSRFCSLLLLFFKQIRRSEHWIGVEAKVPSRSEECESDDIPSSEDELESINGQPSPGKGGGCNEHSQHSCFSIDSIPPNYKQDGAHEHEQAADAPNERQLRRCRSSIEERLQRASTHEPSGWVSYAYEAREGAEG